MRRILLIAMGILGFCLSPTNAHADASIRCRIMLEKIPAGITAPRWTGTIGPPVRRKDVRYPPLRMPEKLNTILSNLSEAQESRPLNLFQHRALAVAVKNHLIELGVPTELKALGDGYFIQVNPPKVPSPKEHYLVRMARSMQRLAGEHEIKIGFETPALLNRYNGKPGSAFFNKTDQRLVLSLYDLLSDRLYSPLGGHEIRHLARGTKNEPQFKFLSSFDEKEPVVLRAFTTEETLDAGLYTIRNLVRRAEKLGKQADKLSEKDIELIDELKREEKKTRAYALFLIRDWFLRARLQFGEYEAILKSPDGSLKVFLVESPFYDRAFLTPSGRRIGFSGKQFNESHGNKDPIVDISTREDLIRESIAKEQALLTKLLDEMEKTTEGLLD